MGKGSENTCIIQVIVAAELQKCLDGFLKGFCKAFTDHLRIPCTLI